MFKRGGSSHQAQGTGITSPFDTPRRQYNLGTSWEEIQENIRRSTADNTTTMQDVAQGFGYLGSPYKESGEAKMLSEMLHEGAQSVRGSRADREKTAQAGELAAQEIAAKQLESDIAISEAAKDRASAEKMAQMESQELKRMPLERLITTIAESPDLKNAVPGSFPSVFGTQIARGRAIQWRLSADGITVGVLEPHLWTNIGTTKDPIYDYKADGLSAKIPWWDPVKSKWHVFNDDGKGNATGDPIKSFLTVDEALAYIKGGNQEIIKKSQTLEENNAQTSESGAKKQVKGGTTQEEMQENVIQVSDIVDKVTDPKTWEGTVGGDTRGWSSNRGAKTYAQKADGGRIGYAEGDLATTELDELNKWWRNQLASAAWNE
tara:strand:- start:111 stop:1241 length:1131 start_codon:yes stop_codon:yes gene_type:complete